MFSKFSVVINTAMQLKTAKTHVSVSKYKIFAMHTAQSKKYQNIGFKYISNIYGAVETCNGTTVFN